MTNVLQEIVDEQRAQIAQLVSRIEELTAEVASVTDERRHAVAAVGEDADRFRSERDEARRMYCEAVILHGTAHRFNANGVPEEITDAKEFARRLRWDCFKEER